MKKALLILSLALISMGAGCASLENNPEIARLAVQAATLRVIGGDQERADRVEYIAKHAASVLGGERVSVTFVETAVRSKIRWDELDPHNVLLAEALISSVRDELEARIGAGVLDQEKLVQVRVVLSWVADAAALV